MIRIVYELQLERIAHAAITMLPASILNLRSNLKRIRIFPSIGQMLLLVSYINRNIISVCASIYCRGISRNPEPHPLHKVSWYPVFPDFSINGRLAGPDISFAWVDGLCPLEDLPEKVEAEVDGDSNVLQRMLAYFRRPSVDELGASGTYGSDEILSIPVTDTISLGKDLPAVEKDDD